MFFRIFNGRFNSNCINYGQIIVQCVEFNIKRPFVYTFCEILIFVSKMAAGLIHFGLKIFIDLADFQQQVILWCRLHRVQVWRKSERNDGRESAPTFLYKMAAMTSSNWNFQNLRKTALANILESICVDFHPNRLSPAGCRADTHTHTVGRSTAYMSLLCSQEKA